jgi:adenosylcobinamide-GDP ribazoletransferase
VIRRVRREFIYFLVAVQVLTRLPVPRLHGFAEKWMERGVKYFPLTGAIVGTVCAATLLAASHVWQGVLPALLTIAAGIAITGGLHEDGFADFFDSMGGATREARLAIMKDSRIGTYGALALGAGVAIKVFALAGLPLWVAAAAMVPAHAGGRLATVGVISLLPYAGGISAAKIKPLGRGVTGADLAIAAAFGVLPMLLLPRHFGLPALAAGAAAAVFAAVTARRLLGGYTGDVLGAVEQTFEIAFLLTAAACA